MLKYKMNEDLAELYGVMMGDGCLSRYFATCEKKEIFCTLITGHTHDEPYYRQVLQPILIKEFGVKGCIRFRKDCNAVRFETTHKHVFDFFSEFGFPIGLKNILYMPSDILLNNNLSISCIRGIFDTDGSIYRRYSKMYKNHRKQYNYCVIQFKLKSHQTIKQIKDILKNNSIKTTKIGIIKDSYFVFRVTEQQSIHRFMKLIKPSNKYHVERYLNYMDSANDYGPIAQPG